MGEEQIDQLYKMRNRQLRNLPDRTASKWLTYLILLIACSLLPTVVVRGADPGTPYLPDDLVSDHKPGSILFFNVYTSDATDSKEQNAKFAITNTSPTVGVAVHIFFVDGMSGSPADFIFCLTPSQTISFESVELDPNTEGYIIVIATNADGAPIVHNHLIGDVYVKFSSGHRAGLGALAVAARNVPTVLATDSAVDIDFNGVSFDKLPLTLAVNDRSEEFQQQSAQPAMPIGDILRSGPFYLLAFGSLCSIGAVGATNQHLKLYLTRDSGFGQDKAANVIALVLLTSNIGRLLMGWLADRYPKKYVMILIYLLVAAGIPLLFFIDQPGVIYLFAIVFGIGMGGDYMIIPLMAAELFGLRVMGRIMGLIIVADGLAEAWVPKLVGRLRDQSPDYSKGFAVMIALALLGAVAIAFLPRRLSSPAPEQR